MKNKEIKLDTFEKQIEEELERDEWVEAENSENIKEKLIKGAKNYLNRKTIFVQLDEKEFKSLREKSKTLGVSYQTIIKLLVEGYIKGEYELKL